MYVCTVCVLSIDLTCLHILLALCQVMSKIALLEDERLKLLETIDHMQKDNQSVSVCGWVGLLAHAGVRVGGSSCTRRCAGGWVFLRTQVWGWVFSHARV